MEAKLSNRKNLLTGAVRVLARLARVVEKACQDAGLSLPQYRLLLYISLQTQRAGELANMAAVSRPTLTDLVDGLERQDLLRRVPVEGDRRGIGLKLTDAGAAKIEEAERALTERLEGFGIDDACMEGLLKIGKSLDRELAKILQRAVGK